MESRETAIKVGSEEKKGNNWRTVEEDFADGVVVGR